MSTLGQLAHESGRAPQRLPPAVGEPCCSARDTEQTGGLQQEHGQSGGGVETFERSPLQPEGVRGLGEQGECRRDG